MMPDTNVFGFLVAALCLVCVLIGMVVGILVGLAL